MYPNGIVGVKCESRNKQEENHEGWQIVTKNNNNNNKL